MYRYDLHVHTSEASRCGRSPAKDIARAYADAGYQGIVITDHFIHGNTAVPEDLPWKERMHAYEAACLEAREEGTKRGLDVLFGLEHRFGDGGKEVLVYGILPDVLAAHPEIESMEIEAFCRFMHQHGAYLSMAHPFREKPYIPHPGVSIDPALLDAIEVYNAGNREDENFRALYYAFRHKLGMTSGGDVHDAESEQIGRAGMLFPNRITSEQELARALFAGEGQILCGGKPCDC